MSFVTENILLITIAVVSGGLLLWPLVSRGTGGALLDTLSATRLINDSHAVVVDVRTPDEFAGGHLPNARNLPLDEFEKRSAELPADKPVLLYCAGGPRAGKAAGVLRKAGRAEVFTLAGGVQAWRQAGLPLVK